MRIALVHDYLVQDGGAERVLSALQEIWPDAPTYALLYDRARMGSRFGGDIRTSFLQHIPFAVAGYKSLMPLMPTAIERYDFSAYDVVLSSASAFAKGVRTRPETLHICYCHTPTRYLSDMDTYLRHAGFPMPVRRLAPLLLDRVRAWDQLAAGRVDQFIANSETVRGRIAAYYRRESDVIHPPVDTRSFALGRGDGGYYLAGGRLVAYKRFDLIIRAFNKLGLPLKIFGQGPDARKLHALAKKNIEFLGRVSDEEKAALYASAIAYLNPQEEDFGITAVEAMAAGRPVIAFRKGGATETVVDGLTGVFLEEQSWEELANQIIRFDAAAFDPAAIRAHAERFDREIFKTRIRAFVERAYAARQGAVAAAAPVTETTHATHRDRHPTFA